MGLTAVDVFAGGGGLTVGLKRAGFEVVAAIEIEEHAYATYRANHPEVHALKRDVRAISGRDLLAGLGRGRIDLLAGCPPCQGFTSLTSKYRRDDARDALVSEVARLARELRPRAIMMENVPGLKSRKGRHLYEGLWHDLEALGYQLADGILEVADYGVPQRRKRLVLLGGWGFRMELPRPSHSERGEDGLAAWRTVRDAIGHMGRPMMFNKAKEEDAVGELNWHVVRELSEKNMLRIRSVRAGETWESIPETLRPACHRGGYRGFSNVYGRMRWDRPSPTITGGCTTFSKGRFGHPVHDRTISVREAALLQTFPADYRFDTPYMEHACNVVGNALPCDFAEVVSRRCWLELSSARDKSRSNQI